MISGARYHRVATYPVISSSVCLAKPKSRICNDIYKQIDTGPSFVCRNRMEGRGRFVKKTDLVNIFVEGGKVFEIVGVVKKKLTRFQRVRIS